MLLGEFAMLRPRLVLPGVLLSIDEYLYIQYLYFVPEQADRAVIFNRKMSVG